MRLLIDAHLPMLLRDLLKAAGHDAIHTRDLPLGNSTPDAEINRISMIEQRIVVTKDADFVNSLLINGMPYKLLLISTGNITNRHLLHLVSMNLEQLNEMFDQYIYVELERTHINIHR